MPWLSKNWSACISKSFPPLALSTICWIKQHPGYWEQAWNGPYLPVLSTISPILQYGQRSPETRSNFTRLSIGLDVNWYILIIASLINFVGTIQYFLAHNSWSWSINFINVLLINERNSPQKIVKHTIPWEGYSCGSVDTMALTYIKHSKPIFLAGWHEQGELRMVVSSAQISVFRSFPLWSFPLLKKFFEKKRGSGLSPLFFFL